MFGPKPFLARCERGISLLRADHSEPRPGIAAGEALLVATGVGFAHAAATASWTAMRRGMWSHRAETTAAISANAASA
jgi:hypothetical protein